MARARSDVVRPRRSRSIIASAKSSICGAERRASATGRARGHQHVGVPGRASGSTAFRRPARSRARTSVAGNGVHRRHTEGRGGDAQRMSDAGGASTA
jgi:hypothetical protein